MKIKNLLSTTAIAIATLTLNPSVDITTDGASVSLHKSAHAQTWAGAGAGARHLSQRRQGCVSSSVAGSARYILAMNNSTDLSRPRGSKRILAGREVDIILTSSTTQGKQANYGCGQHNYRGMELTNTNKSASIQVTSPRESIIVGIEAGDRLNWSN